MISWREVRDDRPDGYHGYRCGEVHRLRPVRRALSVGDALPAGEKGRRHRRAVALLRPLRGRLPGGGDHGRGHRSRRRRGIATFTADPRWLPEGAFDTAQLVRLMASRRSCRQFQGRPVERALLEDLVKIGVTAPSGTNSQVWTFTLLPDRAAVEAFGDQVARFFRRINRMAENPLLRNGLKLLGKRELADYYRDYHQSVSEALDEREKTGRDRLFHGATAAIVVGIEAGREHPQGGRPPGQRRTSCWRPTAWGWGVA